MNTKVWSILTLTMLAAVLSAASVAAAADVYMMPQESTALVGTEVEVEIWVNATGLKAGQINMTYDSSCVNVTDFVMNETTFPMSGGELHEGRGWITFLSMERSLTGNYQVVTLTIKCVSDEDCETRLEFDEHSKMPCKLSDRNGSKIPSDWISGAFNCEVVDKAPATADGDTHDGSTTADTDEAEDTNVTSDAKDEKEAPAVNETASVENETVQATPTPAPEASPAVVDKPEAEGPTPEPTPATQTPTSTPQSSSVHVIVALAAIVFTAVIISLRRCKK